MWRPKAWKSWIPLVTAVLLGLLSCTQGHQEPLVLPYQPLVFPGEARLGASALMVIDSNQFQIGDQLESYDLHRDRVKILVEGDQGTAYANLRSVFAVETGRATTDSKLRRNSWVMLALFDLPTANIFTLPYPRHASLHLEIDDEEVPELEGVIWVLGEGGEPTSLGLPAIALEEALEPRSTIRLRARSGAVATAFQPSWTIGAIQVEVAYDATCLEAPSAHAGSDAIGAGVTVGPPIPSSPSGWMTIKVLLTQPRGFTLPAATTVDPSRLGTGPILDVAFDRDEGCTDALNQSVEVRSLKIVDRDGRVLSSGPSPAATFDSAQFFHVHYVDPEQS